MIRQANKSDIKNISKVYTVCFPNEIIHDMWISSCFNSFPKSVYYVHDECDEIQGYILWSVKNGFRTNVIIELEQLGVHPDHSGQGIGRKLISQSFEMFKSHIAELELDLGSVMVTTSEGNYAEELYKYTLGVTRNGIIKEYGSGNELILFNKIKI
ncbi:MAG: GNAT family N-acetyltransferase [Thalassotalea sp.]